MGSLDKRTIINRLRGIIPTTSVWGVTPTNLERCTDGDWDTPTGTGTTIMGAAGALGILDFDMGAVYNVLLRLKVGMWMTASNIRVISYYWDGAAWQYTWGDYNLCLGWEVAEGIKFNVVPFARTSRIRLQFYAIGAMTGNVRVYEVEAIDIGI